jgi:hypothetical protein
MVLQLGVQQEAQHKKPASLKMRFVAFPAIEYDEILSGYRYQPGQMVEQ